MTEPNFREKAEGLRNQLYQTQWEQTLQGRDVLLKQRDLLESALREMYRAGLERAAEIAEKADCAHGKECTCGMNQHHTEVAEAIRAEAEKVGEK